MVWELQGTGLGLLPVLPYAALLVPCSCAGGLLMSRGTQHQQLLWGEEGGLAFRAGSEVSSCETYQETLARKILPKIKCCSPPPLRNILPSESHRAVCPNTDRRKAAVHAAIVTEKKKRKKWTGYDRTTT